MPQNNLTPWQWAPPGRGAAGFSTAVMGLFSTECINCEYYQGTRPSCKYYNDFFNGTYPKAPPPAVWFTTEAGQPICTGKKIVDVQKMPEKLKVLVDPKKEPGPPAPDLPPIPPTLYHAESDHLFCVDTIEEAEECMAQGCDMAGKVQVLETLYSTIFKKSR